MIRICMKLGIALILISLSSIKVSAQGIAINSNGVKADKSAILDVSAINKGILIPRVALQNINDKVTIPSPAHSLLVYNTSENIYGKGFYYNKGTDDDPLWMQLGVTPVNSAWLTGGNDDVNDDVSYMGTNIDEDVVFRRNGTLSMQIRTGGALLATGDATGVTPTEGKGSRLMWIPAKAAFRVGGITEDYADAWNDEFIGQYSFAAGQNARAQGDYSVAMGYNTLATDPYSTALGGETKAQHFFALATGLRTVAMGNSSTAMGFRSMASGSASVAMGDSTEAKGDVSIAMGYKTFAEGDHSTATGYQTHAIGNRSTAMGENTKAVGEGSFASGKGSDALGEYSTVFGEATAIGNYSIAGGTAIATAEYATAFGFGATANGLHSFAAGSGANAMGDRSAAFNNGTTDKDANGNILRQSDLVCNDKGHPIQLSLLDGSGNSFGKEVATYLYDINKVITSVVSNDGKTLSSDTIKISFKTASLFPNDREIYNTNGDLINWTSKNFKGEETTYEEEYSYDSFGNCIENRIYKVSIKRNGNKKRNIDRIFKKDFTY